MEAAFMGKSMTPLKTPAQQLIKPTIGGDDRSMLMMSDDSAMMKQVMETHSHDGREVDVKPLLLLAEDILSRATSHVDSVTSGIPAHHEGMKDGAYQASFVHVLDFLFFTIDRISCELACKALSGGEAHPTTLAIFKLVSNFTWDAKLVLTMAAFALNYGEFWLLAQIYTSNQLARSMAMLRQVPVIMEHSGPLKPRFDALNNLIKAMLDVTRIIVELKELPSVYISQDIPAISEAMTHVPTAVYWTIRSAVACAAQITSISALGHEYIVSTTVAWELSTLAHKLKNIYEHLQKQLSLCRNHIEERRDGETYQHLLSLFDAIHIDNMKILKALIYPKDDIQPLLDGPTKKRVHIDVLRRKNVLLLISSPDISHEELSMLEQIHSESKVHGVSQESQYELVWIPILDHMVQWTDEMQKKFESLQSTMPWYSVYHPKLIDRAVARFIKEKWYFGSKPILVVLDQ